MAEGPWLKLDSPEAVINRGVVVEGNLRVEYYTSQPGPTQWIAVGLVEEADLQRGDHPPRRLLVGTGTTEPTAVAALRRRLARLAAPATDYVVDWAIEDSSRSPEMN